jgi:ribosomal-protein-alanine N-acetyltransferase
MSGHMKVFFDRFSELLTTRKDQGRRLRGKDVAVIACGTDPRLPEGFEAPFRQTCDYLGMRYHGAFYLQFEGDRIARRGAAGEAQAFAAKLARLAGAAGGDPAATAWRPQKARLERPGLARQQEFLAAVGRSKRLHGRFVTPPATASAYRKWLSRMRGAACDAHFVVDAGSGELAGMINLSEIVRGALQSAYVGYCGFTPHTGRGLMTEGMRLVISHAFGELGLHRIEANIQPDNVASIALVRRLGFTREGYSPRYLRLNGRWRDHERWALLRENWRPGSLRRSGSVK